MSDTLAKLKVVLEAATSPYRKEMEKVKQVTKGVSETIQNETSKIKQASKMDSVTESVKKQASVIQKMKQAVTRYQVKAGIKVPTEDYKELQAGLEKAESSLGSLMEKQKKYEAIGVNKKGSSWKSLIYDIDEARNSVENYKNEISNMEADGTAFVKPFSTIKNIFKGLGSISLKGFGGMLKGVGAGVKTLSSGAIRVSSGVFGALIQKFASGVPILRRFVGAQKSVSGGFGGGLKNILKYTLGIRSLFVLINKLRSAAVEGFKNLAQYSGETNNSISMLMSSLTQLKNSVAAAFAPILNVVAPILNTLIQKIISVFNVIGQLTSAHISLPGRFSRTMRRALTTMRNLQRMPRKPTRTCRERSWDLTRSTRWTTTAAQTVVVIPVIPVLMEVCHHLTCLTLKVFLPESRIFQTRSSRPGRMRISQKLVPLLVKNSIMH